LAHDAGDDARIEHERRADRRGWGEPQRDAEAGEPEAVALEVEAVLHQQLARVGRLGEREKGAEVERVEDQRARPGVGSQQGRGGFGEDAHAVERAGHRGDAGGVGDAAWHRSHVVAEEQAGVDQGVRGVEPQRDRVARGIAGRRWQVVQRPSRRRLPRTGTPPPD
jgi:hypothetical protein